MSGLTVSSGVTSSGIVLSNGGVLTVASGGTAASATVNAGGIADIARGGSAVGIIVNSRGLDQVLNGGIGSGAVLSGFGAEKVYGAATGTVVGYAASQTVFGGGTATGSVVNGTVVVSAGGVTLGAELIVGQEIVSSGGLASGTVVAYSIGGVPANGQMFVASGGTATGAVVDHDGFAYLSAGALAVGTTLSGGDLTLGGGTAIGTTIGSGSVEIVSAVYVFSTGVFALGLADATTIDGGTLELDGGSATGGILFTGSGPGLLDIGGSAMPATGISGFAGSDEIDLQSIAFTGSGSVSLDAVTDVLTVTEGGSSFALQLAGTPTNGRFDLASDTGTGTIIRIDDGSAGSVSSGVVSSGIVLGAGGVLNVLPGGAAIGTIVLSRGLDAVMSGGLSSDTVLSGFGAEAVYGAAIGTVVGYAASQTVFAGGTATSSFVDGSVIVSAGGVTDAAQLIDGDEFVLSGGVASGTVVAASSGNGEIGVASGGTMAGTVIERNGYAYVSAGGLTVSTILSGGDLALGGGTAIGTTVGSGGVETAGFAYVSSVNAFVSGVASDTTIDGGTLDLAGGTATGGIFFTGSGAGLLEIDGSVMPAAAISGFSAADEIDLQSVAFTGSGSVSLNSTTDMLTVTENLSSFLLQLSGPYAGVTFGLEADSGSGTLVVIDGGGMIDVASGAMSSGLVLSAGDVVNVLSGGTAISTEVLSRGFVDLLSGGIASQTVLSSGGNEAVHGAAFDTVVGNAASQTVFAGGTAISSLVDGSVVVSAGGLTLGIDLIAGQEFVAAGGVASGTVVAQPGAATPSDGEIFVASGGTAAGIVVDHDGYAYLSVGAVAVGTILSGGDLALGGGTAIDTTIGSGAIETASVVYVFSTGIYYSGVADATTIDGGTLDLEGGSAADGIRFTGGGPGLLEIGGTAMPDTAISGFAAADEIDLRSVVFTGSGSVTLNAATDVLTVTEGGSSLTLQLAGSYSGSAFALSPDTGSGTVIGVGTTGITSNLSCFAAGTRIETEHGAMAIEHLLVGDRVATADGGLKPIVWIGSRRVDCRHHPEPAKVWPVLVEAHAFGPGEPRRNLLLSPDHAVFAAGVLIPVKHLINRASIRQIVVPAITYFHVALDAHDVVLAEGLPVESYLDTGDRNAFDGANIPEVLHPAFASERADISLVMETLGYAPLRVTGPEVALVKAQLATRCPPPAHRAAGAPG